MTVSFAARWKEELVCTLPGGALVVEMTMGTWHVYFPTLEKWNTDAPAWARDQYETIVHEPRSWCAREGIALTVDDGAWVYELTG